MSKRSLPPGSKSQPKRKRQRLIKKPKKISLSAAKMEFDPLLQILTNVGPRQQNMEHLIEEWNQRMAELGIYGGQCPQDIAHKLTDIDLELMRQLTSLGRETLKCSMQFAVRSGNCTDIVLDKLQQQKLNRLSEVRNLQKEVVVITKSSKETEKTKIQSETANIKQ